MNGRASRSKGKRGEAAAKRLLIERGYEVMARPRGESGDDFLAIRDGKAYSVECKHTQNLMLSHFIQCRENAHGKARFLMWRPSHWGFPSNLWVVCSWDGREATIQVWHANGGGK
jgi:hypothetical protein